MPCDETWLASRLLALIPLLLSLSVHEWAHAWTASRLGDDTARHLGRLTLNPLAHIDPVGTLLLPLLGVPFGWAKPVPIQPMGFRRDVSLRSGIVLTAAAGPVSNLLLAASCAAILGIFAHLQPSLVEPRDALRVFLETMAIVNVILAVFNAVPVPPLDGSRVVDGLIPDRLRPAWDGFSRFGIVILVAILVLPDLAGYSILRWPVEAARSILDQLAVPRGG